MRALVLAVLLATPAIALADDKTDAVALFDEGIREMKAGNFDKACAAFAKSNEIHADSGTRGSLARCYEKAGRVASAWKLWTDLSTTAPKDLRADAAANATKLEARLPKYVLRMPPSQTAQVTIDGIAVDGRPNVEAAIDPGPHVITATAPGFVAWKHEYTAREGALEEIAIALVGEPQANPSKPIVIDESPSSSRRTIGIAVIAVGGALVAGGAVFGYLAKSRNDDAKDLCGGDVDMCDPSRLAEARDKVDSARSAGNLSTVGFIAGGAAVVTGVVLFVTAPKSARRQISIAPTVGAESAGVVIRGGF